MLVLAQGVSHADVLEPFATVAEVFAGVENELQLVATDGWPSAAWPDACDRALDDLGPTPNQRRRARTQHVADGRLDVLFIERGRIVGSALTLVALRRAGGIVALNTKMAAMELLQAARDALVWDSRSTQRLVKDAREALGIPAGPRTTIASVRLQRGDAPPDAPRVVEDVGESIRRAATGRPTSPAPRPAARAPAAPVPPRPEDRHHIVAGTCSTCGRKGLQLNQPCGRPELGRFGLIELD